MPRIQGCKYNSLKKINERVFHWHTGKVKVYMTAHPSRAHLVQPNSTFTSLPSPQVTISLFPCEITFQHHQTIPYYEEREELQLDINGGNFRSTNSIDKTESNFGKFEVECYSNSNNKITLKLSW